MKKIFFGKFLAHILHIIFLTGLLLVAGNMYANPLSREEEEYGWEEGSSQEWDFAFEKVWKEELEKTWELENNPNSSYERIPWIAEKESVVSQPREPNHSTLNPSNFKNQYSPIIYSNYQTMEPIGHTFLSYLQQDSLPSSPIISLNFNNKKELINFNSIGTVAQLNSQSRNLHQEGIAPLTLSSIYSFLFYEKQVEWIPAYKKLSLWLANCLTQDSTNYLVQCESFRKRLMTMKSAEGWKSSCIQVKKTYLYPLLSHSWKIPWNLIQNPFQSHLPNMSDTISTWFEGRQEKKERTINLLSPLKRNFHLVNQQIVQMKPHPIS